MILRMGAMVAGLLALAMIAVADGGSGVGAGVGLLAVLIAAPLAGMLRDARWRRRWSEAVDAGLPAALGWVLILHAASVRDAGAGLVAPWAALATAAALLPRLAGWLGSGVATSRPRRLAAAGIVVTAALGPLYGLEWGIGSLGVQALRGLGLWLSWTLLAEWIVPRGGTYGAEADKSPRRGWGQPWVDGLRRAGALPVVATGILLGVLAALPHVRSWAIAALHFLLTGMALRWLMDHAPGALSLRLRLWIPAALSLRPGGMAADADNPPSADEENEYAWREALLAMLLLAVPALWPWAGLRELTWPWGLAGSLLALRVVPTLYSWEHRDGDGWGAIASIIFPVTLVWGLVRGVWPDLPLVWIPALVFAPPALQVVVGSLRCWPTMLRSELSGPARMAAEGWSAGALKAGLASKEPQPMGWEPWLRNPTVLWMGLCALAVAWRALAPYAAAAIHHPDEPLSVTILYSRGTVGDITYLPHLYAWARGEPGDAPVPGLVETGVRAVPLLVFVVHLPWVALWGDVGFVVGDVLGALLAFAAVALLMRAFLLPWWIASTLALLVVAGIPSAESAWQRSPPQEWFFQWGWRYPRPFVSDIPFVLCMAAATAWVSGFGARAWAESRGLWVAYGACVAWMAQVNPYAATVAGLFTAGAALFHMGLHPAHTFAMVFRAPWALAGFLPVLAPGLIQRVLAHPDQLLRLGVFPIDRSLALSLWPHKADVLLVQALLGLGALYLVLPRVVGAVGDGGHRPRWLTSALLFGVWIFAGLAGIAAFVGLSGKGLQLYHFNYLAWEAPQWAWTVIGGWGLLIATPHLAAHRRQWFLRAIAVALLWFSCFQSWQVSAALAQAGIPTSGPVSPHVQKVGARTHLSALVRELPPLHLPERPFALLSDSGIEEGGLSTWWLCQYAGRALAPSVFFTAQSDAVHETRLAMAFALLGNAPEQVLAYLVRRPTKAYSWLHNRYCAHRLRIPFPLADYAPDDQQRILATPPTAAWYCPLPRSERERFLGVLRAIDLNTPPFPLPDFVVKLGPRPPERSPEEDAPRASGYVPLADTPHYRIWKRVADPALYRPESHP